MSPHPRTASATFLMAGSLVTVAVCRFLRNWILARMLTPADFGIGATFALTLTFLEMLSDFGPQLQLVQSLHGDGSDWLNAAHALLVLRGFGSASAIFLLAGPIANAFDVPHVVNSIRCLALTPLLRNFDHCDAYWFQRRMLIGRIAALEAIPDLLSLATAPLFALWFGDYRAFLAVILLTAVTHMGLSHLLAERPYRWQWDAAIFREMLRFGLPLIGTGLMLFLIMNGERVLVACYFDDATLGAYSVVFMLAFTPVMLLTRLHNAVALPLFSRAQGDWEEFHRVFRQSSQLMSLAAAALAILFTSAGKFLVETLYGPAYAIVVHVAPWIGLMCALRIARATLSIAAVSLGDTKNSFYANLCRIASFGIAVALLGTGADIVWIPITALAGELTGYGVSLWLLGAYHEVRVGIHARALVAASLFAAAAIGLETSGVRRDWVSTPAATSIGLTMLVACCLLAWREFRVTVAGLFKSGYSLIR